ncbi:MAG: hypothetical protein RLZZ519_1375 [Bacteroidota bacterium]|jgi:hypothetical protein
MRNGYPQTHLDNQGYRRLLGCLIFPIEVNEWPLTDAIVDGNGFRATLWTREPSLLHFAITYLVLIFKRNEFFHRIRLCTT